MNKATLRQAALERRQELSAKHRQQLSKEVMARLQEFLRSDFPDANILLSYRAMNSEVDADVLFDRSDYQLFAPVTHHHEHMEWLEITSDSQWKRGLFGVMEPVTGGPWQGGEPEATLLICPLTAFDRQGNRLGMGKGCFDFWLSEHRSELQGVIGLAFSCQEVASIPVEPHDISMNYIITETEVISCTSR